MDEYTVSFQKKKPDSETEYKFAASNSKLKFVVRERDTGKKMTAFSMQSKNIEADSGKIIRAVMRMRVLGIQNQNLKLHSEKLTLTTKIITALRI
jgi:hypothetical protein